jgi:hypothetical protein
MHYVIIERNGKNFPAVVSKTFLCFEADRLVNARMMLPVVASDMQKSSYTILCVSGQSPSVIIWTLFQLSRQNHTVVDQLESH